MYIVKLTNHTENWLISYLSHFGASVVVHKLTLLTCNDDDNNDDTDDDNYNDANDDDDVCFGNDVMMTTTFALFGI